MPAERVPTPAEGLRGMASDLEPISEPTEELQTIRETEAADKERGFVTEFGESAQEILDLQSDIPNAFAAGLNAITPDALGPIKQATQGLDDLVLSADERDAKFEELIEEGRENNDPMRYVTEAVYGAEKGVEGGLLLPVTIAGAITNQETDAWSDPPEILKDSPLGVTAFEIAQMLVPTIAFAGVGGASIPGGVMTLRAGESLLETATQDELDEVLFGQELAAKFSELAAQVYDDPQVGQDVAEYLATGEGFGAQAFIRTVGFMQNLGFNMMPDAVENVIRGAKNFDHYAAKHIVDAAEALELPVGEVAASVQNRTSRVYTPDTEPSETVTAGTVASASKSDDGINAEALIAEAVRTNDGPAVDAVLKNGEKVVVPPERMPLTGDGLTSAQSEFATNWDAYNPLGEVEAVPGLKLATEYLEKIGDTRWQKVRIASRAAEFLVNNKYLLKTGEYDKFAENCYKLTYDVPYFMRTQKSSKTNKNGYKQQLLDRRVADEAGLQVGAILAERQGVLIQRAAQGINNNINSNVDYLEQANALDQLIQVTNQIMAPVGKGKTRWHVTGAMQTKDELKKTIDQTNAIEAAIKSGDMN